MSDTKEKALVLMNEVLEKRGLERRQYIDLLMPTEEALCRAVELLEQEKVMHAERLLAMDARTTTAETQHGDTKQEFDDFRQEVSDVVTSLCNTLLMGSDHSQICEMLSRRFIIPKPTPDPRREIAEAWGLHNTVAKSWVEDLRANLDALGFEIREKNDGQPNSN